MAPERFSGNISLISSLMEFKYLVLIRDSFPTDSVVAVAVAVAVGLDAVVVVAVGVVSRTPRHTTNLLASYLVIVSQGKFLLDPALRIWTAVL